MAILAGTVTAIIMYFVMRGKRTDKLKYRTGNNDSETERVYEDPTFANQGTKDSVEMTSNPAHEKVVV